MGVARLLIVLVLLTAVGTVAGGSWSDTPADGDIHGPRAESDSRGWNPRVTSESVLRVRETVPKFARAHNQSKLNVSYTYRRLPAQPSIVEATMRIPPQSTSETVTVEFDDTFDVVETRNVTRNDTGYEWGGRQTATVTYRLPLDWSYTNNQAESWTLFRHRTPSIRADSAIDVEREIRVEGEGYVGNGTLVMGAHEVYGRQVAGQTINVIVPDGVSLLYGPGRTADALTNASRSLQIGGRDDVVHAFASPEINTPIAAPYPGSAFNDNVMLVDADSELEVWTHEYVHTRGLAGRRFVDTDGLVWLSEGGAQYYGFLLAIRQGYDEWDSLQEALLAGNGDDSVLSNPDELAGGSDYDKGSLVLAALDQEIRAATDGERTVQDVLRRVNRETDPNLETLLAAVRNVGGPEIAATAEQYITTSTTVEYQPSTERLEGVYGYGSPEMQKEVKSVSAVGQNWTRSLGSGRRYLGPSERLRVTVRVTNNGSVEGTVAVAPRIAAREGEFDRFDETWVGRVTPGESVTRTVAQRFEQPGTYELEGIAAGRVTVVPDRGSASVTELDTLENRTNGGNITIQITVQNDANRRTFISEPVLVDGQQVSTVALVVGPGATQTITRSVPASNGSPRNITVGTVSAVDEKSAPGGSSGAGSQFDLLLTLATAALLVGIAVLVLWVAVRRE